MKGSKVLATELKLYKQASHKTPYEGDHTHEFLVDTMENFVG